MRALARKNVTHKHESELHTLNLPEHSLILLNYKLQQENSPYIILIALRTECEPTV